MKDAIPGTHFQFGLNGRAPFFLLLGVNARTMKVGDSLSFPIVFIRTCRSVAVDVVGIRVGGVLLRREVGFVDGL